MTVQTKGQNCFVSLHLLGMILSASFMDKAVYGSCLLACISTGEAMGIADGIAVLVGLRS
jgi:hypothetical protein